MPRDPADSPSAMPDYLAALDRVRAAEASRRAVVGEGLPSFKVRADYGTIGLTLGTALPTFNLTGAVDVPIFEGGRLQGRLAEADAELRQRRAEAEDMKTEVYYDVRSAFLDLQSTEEELKAATRARDEPTMAGHCWRRLVSAAQPTA